MPEQVGGGQSEIGGSYFSARSGKWESSDSVLRKSRWRKELPEVAAGYHMFPGRELADAIIDVGQQRLITMTSVHHLARRTLQEATDTPVDGVGRPVDRSKLFARNKARLLEIILDRVESLSWPFLGPESEIATAVYFPNYRQGEDENIDQQALEITLKRKSASSCDCFF